VAGATLDSSGPWGLSVAGDIAKCYVIPGCSLCALPPAGWALTVFTASTATRSAGCSGVSMPVVPAAPSGFNWRSSVLKQKQYVRPVYYITHCPVFCLIEPWISLALFIMASFLLNRAIANIHHSPDPERVVVWAPFSTLQRSHRVSKLPR
jgi:hypothetical protein